MVKFRRSPHVVGFWKDSRTRLQNYATATWLGGTADLWTVLDACSSWRSMTQIIERCPGIESGSVRRLVRRMTREYILHRSDRAVPGGERAMQGLGPWNPSAGFFHTAAKQVVFHDDPLFRRRVSQPVRRPVWPVKRYRGSTVLPLPTSIAPGELPDVMLRRRSWRRFGEGTISLQQAAVLLRLTAGMHLFVPTRTDGVVPLRTSPSAGACHPIEVYVLALRVDGLRRGLYHYASDRHVLERMGSVRAGGVQRYLPTQYAFEDAAALVFFCARYDRVLRRYPYARAYRAAAIEAGHLCQTFCLTATWLQLAPFCSMALHDRHLERDLRLDGGVESVLYAAGVGVRPSDRRDAAAPPGTRGRRPVPNPVFLPGARQS